MSDDHKYSNTLILVLGLLVVSSVVIYFLASSMIAKKKNDFVMEDPTYQEQLAERIAPVGRVSIAGVPDEAGPEESKPEPATAGESKPEPTATGESEPEPATAAISGEDIYNSSCVVCHGIGIAGAPKVGDAEAWAPRIEQGLPTMYNHAINGYQGKTGMMPPKGGAMNLSDDEIKAAVDYMAGM